MSRSGSRFRDPYALSARRRKGTPHKETRRGKLEEIDKDEREDMLVGYRDTAPPKHWQDHCYTIMDSKTSSVLENHHEEGCACE